MEYPTLSTRRCFDGLDITICDDRLGDDCAEFERDLIREAKSPAARKGGRAYIDCD
jgi:hypothetical protein